MKSRICIAIFFLSLTYTIDAQNKFPTKINWSSLVVYSTSVYKMSFHSVTDNSPILNKPRSLNYQPAKLPFFCNMEDKCRSRFNIFLKFRAGNDESYRKMIQSGARLRD